MPKASDIGGKRLIGLAPDAWVQWVTQRGDIVAEEIVAADFQWVSRESDVLVRAVGPEIGHVLVLTELQLRYDARMPRRMHAYAALAEERYNLPVYAVLVNILPPPAGTAIADRHAATVLGQQVRRDYRVLNLWEVDAAEVVRQPLPTLLPFVPVLRGGGAEAIVREALRLLRADTEINELEPLLAYFASFVLDTRLVQQIMRWDMVVLEQSPWYQEIVERGRNEERRHVILRMLQHRFGAVPSEISARLQDLSSEQLIELVEATYTDDTLTAFLARLPA